MSQQVKLDEATKKEMAVYAALNGLTLKDLVTTSWEEFKVNHREQLRAGIAWAEGILGDEGAAAVAASGMSGEDVSEIDAAFNGTSSVRSGAEIAAASR